MSTNFKFLLITLSIPFIAISQNVNINVHFKGDCMKLEHGFTDLVIEIENQSDKTAWIKYSNLRIDLINVPLLPEYQNTLFGWEWLEYMSSEDERKVRHDWIKIKKNSCLTICININKFSVLDLKAEKDYVLHNYYVKSGKRKDRNAIIKCNDLTFQMCE